MTHYLLNLTWVCQNRCSYCWVNQTVKTRLELVTAKERPMADWVAAIYRDEVNLVDIAGGEPLLVPWLTDLMLACNKTAFGLSTNGIAMRGLRKLCQVKPPNLIAVNLSYHPEGPQWHSDYDLRWREAMRMMLDAKMPVHTNVVDAPGNRESAAATLAWLKERGIKHEVSPYERMDVLGDKLPQGLCCEGGVNHLTIAPDGSAWPCLSTLRSPYWRETCLGNWIDGELDLRRKPQPCHLNCVDFYVLPQEHSAGDMWGICARPCEGGGASVKILKIGGIPYSVSLVDSFTDDGPDVTHLGEIIFSDATIKIRRNMPPEQRAATLWHEIAHILLRQSGWFDLKAEENLAEAFGFGIAGIIATNGIDALQQAIMDGESTCES